ncbi:MAG TPA: tape measure protein, partial [Microbacterium sp.]|nr:tape measure protein [Microbacterium sp.]
MMSGPVIGYAALQIIPSLRGMDREIKRELGGIETEGRKVGQAAGRGFTSRFMSGMGNLASSIGRALTTSVTTAATVAGGLFATSLVKGMGRLTSIDDARGKLQGLGHDAKAVETIMDSALASVKGTAFGLGEAATVAATAVAAGVKPGQDLTRYLKLVADTSTIAGAGLGEIGSILNKATTSQRVYTMELNQLADRGLPVFTWLQEEYQVSAEELRAMVAAGEVDTARFLDVIERNIGGAALASGETFRGGLANVGAALGRVGATILTPFFEAAKQAFPGIIALFDELGSRVAPVMERIGSSQALERAIEWFKSLPNTVGPAVDRLKELAPVVAPLVGLFAALGTSTIAGALGPLGALIPTVNPLVAAFAGLVAVSPDLQSALKDVFDQVRPLVVELGRQLLPVVEGLVPVVTEVARVFIGVFGDVIAQLAPAIPPLAEAFSEVAAAFGEILIAVAPVIPQLTEIAVLLLEKIGVPLLEATAVALGGIADAIGWLANDAGVLVPILVAGAAAFGAYKTAMVGLEVARTVGAAIRGLSSTISSVSDVAATMGVSNFKAFREILKSSARETKAFQAALKIKSAITGVASALKNAVVQLAAWGKAALVSAANTARQTAALVAQRVATIATEAATKLMAAAQWLLNAAMSANPIFLVVGALAALTAGVVWAYQNVEWFRNLVDNLWGFLKGLANLIGGALSDAFTKVANWFRDLPGNVIGFFSDAATWLYDAGQKILRGLYDGIVWVAENVLKRFYIDLPRTIIGWIGNAAGWLVEKGKDILRGMWFGIVSFSQTVWDWFTNIPSALWGLFKDAATWLVDAGRRIVKGLYDGIVNAPFDVAGALLAKIPGRGLIEGRLGGGNLADTILADVPRRAL